MALFIADYPSAHAAPFVVQPERATPIDMLNLAQTCQRLAISPAGLLDLVNRGELAAYAMGEGIRFRASQVEAAAQSLLDS